MSEKNKKSPGKAKNKNSEVGPLMAFENRSYASTDGSSSLRKNSSSVIKKIGKFSNIDDGLIPFKGVKTRDGENISIREAIILCQKCYYNFSVFRNVIDTMTEFSVSNIYFRGGSEKSRSFFESYFRKVDVWDVQERFFREYYRSGNVFIYRYDSKVSKEDVKKITQTFGKADSSQLEVETSDVVLPSRYSIINPADIQLHGSINFIDNKYYKILTDYELERIRNPKTDEDLEVFNGLDEESKKILKQSGKSSSVKIALNPDKICVVFYKKQDYEPFAVPMGYPVLEDINFKYEMKKMDMAIARTMQQAVLLVTLGDVPEKGGINQENLKKMQKLFENESVGRVLIADYTTKAQFIVPQIGDLLDPKKYEVIDKDINIGLNNIFVGGEKFANQTAKVELFISRLTQARKAFITYFLLPEIKRIAKNLGFKNFPTPYFEDFKLNDNPDTLRIYSRLIELGVLTPSEGIQAIETNRLPTKEESLISQKEYKELRNKGYYEPLMGGPSTQMELAEKSSETQIKISDKALKTKSINSPTPTTPKKEEGRPSGTKGIPYKSNRKITPIGGEEGFSMAKIKEFFILSQELEIAVATILREKHNIKRLNNKQKEVSRSISNIIMTNEEPNNWLAVTHKYCEKPTDSNKERVLKITEIACKYNTDIESASVLYASQALTHKQDNTQSEE